MTDRAFEPLNPDPFSQFNPQADKINYEPAPPAKAPSPAALPQEPADPFANFDTQAKKVSYQTEADSTSAIGSFLRSTARSVLPAVGSFPAMGAGAELGAALGSPGGPVGMAVGGAAGALIAGIGSSMLISHGQDYALSKMPDAWVEGIGQDDAQKKLDEQQHSKASFLGGLLPYLVTMRPGSAPLMTLPENATAFQRIMANPTTSRVFGGALQGGMELGNEALSDNPVEWSKVAIATGFGVVWNAPNRIGQRLTEVGASPARPTAEAIRSRIGRPDTAPAVSEPGTPETAPAPAPESAVPGSERFVITDYLGAKADGDTLGVSVMRDADGKIEALLADDGFVTKVGPAYRDMSPQEAIAHTLGDHPQGTPPDISKVKAADEATAKPKPTRYGVDLFTPPAEERPITVADAADLGVMGPGVTKSTFEGAHERDPSAVQTARDAKRTEQSVIGPDPQADVHHTAERMHPELFEHYAELKDQQRAMQDWFATHEGEIPPNPAHLVALAKELNEIEPQIAAAYRRAAEAAGTHVVEPDVAANAEASSATVASVPFMITNEMKARLAERGMTPEQIKELTPAQAHDILNAKPAEAPAVRTIEQQRDYIRDDVAKQLVAAGRPAEEAQAAAALIAARYETRAAAFGGKRGTAEELYNADAAEILGPGARSQQSKGQPRAAPKYEKLSALQFIASRGGIKADDPLVADVQSIFGAKNKFVPGFGQLIRKNGLPLDQMREAMAEAGYFPAHGTTAEAMAGTKVNHLLDVLAAESKGRRELKPGEEPAIESHRDDHLNAIEQEIDVGLKEVGIDPASLSDNVRARTLEIMDREGVRDPVAAYEKAESELGLFQKRTNEEIKADVDKLETELKTKHGLSHLSLQLTSHGDLNLGMIEVPRELRKQGKGTAAVQEITDFADQNGLRITLTPGLKDNLHGTTSRGRLVDFYKELGFVENKGRNKDFAISDGMYREPKPKEFEQRAGDAITPEFKEWFGDSKVIDNNGKPLVVYHGTKSDFDRFDAKNFGASDDGLVGKGFYFTYNPAEASGYALNEQFGKGGNPNVIPAYVSVKNPLVITQGVLPDGRKIGEVHLGGINSKAGNSVRELAEKAGHDGVVFTNRDGDIRHVVAWKPEQIKSVNNRGTFDPNNPRILEQRETISAPKQDGTFTDVDQTYPRVTDKVSGLTIRKDVPNTSSIRASISGDYTELPGIREVKVSDFDGAKPVRDKRTEKLAAEIADSGEINPLIVVVDEKGPYILEGSHRFDALQINGHETFPAVVVVEDAAYLPGKPGAVPADFDWKIADKAERSLTGPVAKALDTWIGGHVDATTDPAFSGGIWHPGPLKRVLANPVLKAQLHKAMEPVRAALRAEHGDRITLYRYHGPIPEDAKPYDILSFTSRKRIAEQLADAPREQQLFTPEEIKTKEAELASHGVVKIDRYELKRNEFGSLDIDDPNVGGFLTDTSSVREFMNSLNEARSEVNTGRSERLQNVGEYSIPVDDIIAVTDRFNQKEFVVHNKDKTLFQEQPETLRGKPVNGTMRGKIIFNEQLRPIIRLTKDANASTFIHETGHEWLEQMMKDASHSLATDQLRTDAAIIDKWLGIAPGEKIPTPAHEKFARGFEQYLREGVAPSPQLASVFAKFKQWLVQIYQTLKGLGQPISEDIRGVFDRMLAGEPQRTVIAPEKLSPPSRAEVHEADAVHAAPHEAEAHRDRIVAESNDHYNALPEDIRREHEAAIAETAKLEAEGVQPGATADVAGEAGAGQPERGEVVGAGNEPELESTGGAGGAEHGAERQGGAATERQGADVSGTAQRPGGGEKSESVPLAPTPAANFSVTDQTKWISKEGNIRVENITSVPEFKAAIDEAAQRTGQQGQGTVTMGEMLDLAEISGIDPIKVTETQLASMFGGVQGLASKVWALRTAVKDSAQIVSNAMRAVRDDASDANAAAFALAISRHDMLQSTLSGVTAEVGRGLGMGFRKMEGWEKAKDLNQFMKENTGRTLFQLKQMAKLGSVLYTPAQVSKFVADAQKRTFGKMVLEYWINGLLSGPATHSTNTIGNMILTLQHAVPETAAAAAIGRIRTMLGREGETVRIGEIGARLKGLTQSLPSALQATGESFRASTTVLLPGEEARPLPYQTHADLAPHPPMQEGMTYNNLMTNAFGAVQGLRDATVAMGQLIKAGGAEGAPTVGAQYALTGSIPDIQIKGVTALPLGTIARLPGRFLSAADSFFRVANYSMAKNAIAYRTASEEGHVGTAFDARVAEIRDNPTEAMMTKMVEEATELTLQAKGGKLLQALQHLAGVEIGGFPVMKFITPFVHVAGNIMKQTLVQRTPFGMFSPEIRADLAGKNGNIAADMAMARMVFGTTLAVTFGTLAAQGYASGSGPTDPNEAAMWRLAGNQAHSVRIGDMWYGVQKLGPLGLLMGLSADLYDVAHSASEGEMTEAAAHLVHAVSQNVLDQSMMKGPAELLRAIQDSDRYGEAYVRSFLSGFVPMSVGMAQMARIGDPYSRQTRTIIDAIRNKIPGHLDSMFEQGLFPKRDIWGEEMKAPDALGGRGVTGIYESQISTDPVNVAMLDLGLNPAKVERTIRNVDLTEQQYDDYARIAGRMTKMRLDAIVKSGAFSSWPNHVKHDVMQETIKQSRESARGMLMMRYPQIVRDAVAAKMEKFKD